MRQVRQLQGLSKQMGRSRMSNGAVLPKVVDQRSPWARRFRDLLVLHANDRGGPDACSEAERAIIRRAATLIVSLEQMETKFAQNGEANLDELETYQRCSNTMQRLLKSVGLKRVPKTVNPPTLSEYLKRKPKPKSEVIEVDAEEANS
jgi:hypothetical protein